MLPPAGSIRRNSASVSELLPAPIKSGIEQEIPHPHNCTSQSITNPYVIFWPGVPIPGQKQSTNTCSAADADLLVRPHAEQQVFERQVEAFAVARAVAGDLDGPFGGPLRRRRSRLHVPRILSVHLRVLLNALDGHGVRLEFRHMTHRYLLPAFKAPVTCVHRRALFCLEQISQCLGKYSIS